MDVRRLCVTSLLVVFAACSGGGGDGTGEDDPQEPSPQTFAVRVNTGLAVGFDLPDVAVLGNRALVPVSELEMNADLNGDGDRFDRVLYELDLVTGDSSTFSLAVQGKVYTNDAQFLFLVSELDQRIDLNGDGDTADSVWHSFDPQRVRSGGNPRNLSLATPLLGAPAQGADGGFVLVVSEAAQGADLNGDSDQSDLVAHAYENGNRRTTAVAGAPYRLGTPLVARGRRVLVAGTEAGAGGDLTGDNDTLDTVLTAVIFNPGPPTFVPVGPVQSRAVHPQVFALTERHAVYLIDEASSGATDLNNDADAADMIVAVFDLQGASGEVLPNDAGLAPPTLAAHVPTGLHTSDNRILFGFDESAAGLDVNADQDTTDAMLSWIDIETQPNRAFVRPLVLGPVPPVVEDKRALVALNEAQSALLVGIDFNFDGDINDNVAFLFEMRDGGPGVEISMALAVGWFEFALEEAVLGVIESAQSETDFNGDGDRSDIVPFFADLRGAGPRFVSLGTAAQSARILGPDGFRTRLALLVPEQAGTNLSDLNSDGDSMDNAVLWVDVERRTDPPTVLDPTPFVAGVASFQTAPPFVVGLDRLLFASSELMAGADLNEDGDQDDTVLVLSRRLPPE
ncbi:MAG: hypothetical protein AAGD14_06000 [Planctomycetota bacterium]